MHVLRVLDGWCLCSDVCAPALIKKKVVPELLLLPSVMQWRCRPRNAVLCLLLAASGAHDAAPPPTPTPAIESVMRVWSTPFVATRLQNHQDLQVLVQLVRALQKVDPGVQKSNKKAATACIPKNCWSLALSVR